MLFRWFLPMLVKYQFLYLLVGSHYFLRQRDSHFLPKYLNLLPKWFLLQLFKSWQMHHRTPCRVVRPLHPFKRQLFKRFAGHIRLQRSLKSMVLGKYLLLSENQHHRVSPLCRLCNRRYFLRFFSPRFHDSQCLHHPSRYLSLSLF